MSLALWFALGGDASLVVEVVMVRVITLAAINSFRYVTIPTTKALASYATTSIAIILASYATISITTIATVAQLCLPP